MTDSSPPPDTATATTLDHYNRRAVEFEAGTRDHDVSQNIAALLEHIEGRAPFRILDLGCGPGDIPVRLARALPDCRITGIDASRPMIALAEQAVRQAGVADRVTVRCERFQDLAGANQADAVISNSLLHHLPNPLQFWHKLRLFVKPGSPVLVMDLLRPESPEAAQIGRAHV